MRVGGGWWLCKWRGCENHIIYAQGLRFCNGFVHYFLVLSNAQFSAGLSLGGPGDGLQLLGDIRWGREAQVFDSP